MACMNGMTQHVYSSGQTVSCDEKGGKVDLGGVIRRKRQSERQRKTDSEHRLGAQRGFDVRIGPKLEDSR